MHAERRNNKLTESLRECTSFNDGRPHPTGARHVSCLVFQCGVVWCGAVVPNVAQNLDGHRSCASPLLSLYSYCNECCYCYWYTLVFLFYRCLLYKLPFREFLLLLFLFFIIAFTLQLNSYDMIGDFTLSDLLDKPWSQVSSLLPRYVPSFLSRIGFSIPTARRFSSSVANSRSRAFR